MPIATDSGYLPDWLRALLGQGSLAADVPTGLFSETAASPSPAVGLLSSLPQFTGVRPDAPAFQGGNAPNGPLPDQSPTFSYMSPTPPWGGLGPSNSYPSMTMPQDPGPMNIGPGGAGPSFAGVNPNAPFMANGPTSVQDQYANVPLPPRRPTSLTDFQAQADPQDINTPPPGQPNANVIGTQASGAPEVTAQQSLGLGDYLGKAANAIGSIYGAGGPGDALIALGLSNRTGGASIQALNAMNANRVADVKLQLLKNQLVQQQQQQNATYKYFISKGVSPQEAQAATLDPNLGKKKFEEFAGASGYDTVTLPDNSVFRISKTDPNDRTLLSPPRPDLPKVIGKDEAGQEVYGISTPQGIVRTDVSGTPLGTGVPASGLPSVRLSSSGDGEGEGSSGLPPVVRDVPPPGTPQHEAIRAKGEAYLATLPTGFAAQVKAISEGREPYPVGLRTAGALALKNAVNQYDPTFDYTNAKARADTRSDFAKGEAAKSITTGNTVIGHLGHMSDWAEKLAQNNTSIPAFNTWKNKAAINLGGGLAPMNYDTWADLVSKEATKYYSPGGGTEGEREALKSRLQSAASPDQLRSTLNTITDAIDSKTQSLQARWKNGMGPLSPDYPILTPESQGVLDKVRGRVSNVEGGTANSTSTPTQKLLPPPKVGERDPDTGLIYMGGDPSKQSSWKPGGVRM
jgi:hypothetical protein